MLANMFFFGGLADQKMEQRCSEDTLSADVAPQAGTERSGSGIANLVAFETQRLQRCILADTQTQTNECTNAY